MKIGILSADPKLYSTRRLREAAQARGHSVRILTPAKFSIAIEPGRPELFIKGKPAPRLDAIIPRIGAYYTFFGTAVVRQFEQMGVYTLNPSHAISVSRDKLRTLQILSRHKVGIPPSAFVLSDADIPAAIERVGSAPVIIKLLQGSQGAGVMLAESNAVAHAMVQALAVAHQNVLIQKFVEESRGRDIRAFVVGDRVVASMRRIAKNEEFRSNVHLGASTEAVKLEPEYERAALLSAHILGLRVAGVDLLETRDGPQVLEVNSSPGLEGIEEATKIDIASEIIHYLEEQILFPDIDLNERLSLGRGYCIVEIPVSRTSLLVGKTLGDLKLGEQEIQVLSITRSNLHLPSPSLAETLCVGDLLLCFGKQLSLAVLLPKKKAAISG